LEVAVKPCLKIWIACLAVSFSALPALSQFTAANVSPIYPLPNQNYGPGIAVADFNGDGHPDIASTSYQPSPIQHGIQIQLGNGRGAFYPGSFVSPPQDPCGQLKGTCDTEYLFAGDFNGDGKQDLIVFEQNNLPVFLFLGNGDGTFQAGTELTALEGSQAWLATADLRHNGRTDLMLIGPPGAQVFLANDDGTFQAPVIIPTPSGYYAGSAVSYQGTIVAGDLGNGHSDILFLVHDVYNRNYYTAVAMGNGDGTFQPAVLGTRFNTLDNEGYVWGLTLGHFTPDGRLGLAYLFSPDGEQSYSLGMMPGNGDGTFSQNGRTWLGFRYYVDSQNLLATDINGDGLDEIALNYTDRQTGPGTSSFSGIDVRLTNSGPTTAPTSITTFSSKCKGEYSGFLLGADFTGSGHMDLIQASVPCDLILYNFRNRPIAATTTLTSSDPVADYDGPLSIQATVAPTVAKQGFPAHPGGGVRLYNGTQLLAQRPLIDGVASFDDLLLPPARYALTAIYSGDSSYYGSTTAAPVNQVIQGAPATVTLTSDPYPISTFSTPITFTAKMGGSVTLDGTTYTPPGLVSFYANNKLLGQRTIQNGTATFTANALPVGSDAVYAKYLGNSRFAAATSKTLTQTVVAIPTHVSLVSSGSPVTAGQPATFTATITRDAAPDPAQPNGYLIFYIDGVKMGPAPIVNGVATFTTSTLPTGTWSITAQFPSGSTAFAPSTSNAVSITVQ
jgi:hypothetical protein